MNIADFRSFELELSILRLMFVQHSIYMGSRRPPAPILDETPCWQHGWIITGMISTSTPYSTNLGNQKLIENIIDGRLYGLSVPMIGYLLICALTDDPKSLSLAQHLLFAASLPVA